MGMERLLDRLREEARSRCEELLVEAREEAERVRAEAREEIEELRRRRLGSVESETRAAVEREVAEARGEAAAARLEARASALDRVFERAVELLADAVTDPRYRDLARADFERAARYVGDREVSVRCPPAVGSVLQGLVREVGEDVEVVEDPDVDPGFRLVAADGFVEVDATLTTWLERLRPELAIEVTRRLEG